MGPSERLEGSRTCLDHMTDSPAVFHVGGFVHADRQLDLQVCVLAVLGNHHVVELGLLWPVCGWIKDHLRECRMG